MTLTPRLVDPNAFRENFQTRFSTQIPGYHDAILQAKDEACFFCNTGVFNSTRFFDSMILLAVGSGGSPKNLPLFRLHSVGSDVVEFLLSLFTPLESATIDYFARKDWNDQQHYDLVMDTLSLRLPYDLASIPQLMVHAMSASPFTQYAVAAAAEMHDLATEMSTRLAEEACKADEIPGLAKIILQRHAPKYIDHLTAWWEARAKSEDFYRLNLMYESIEYTSQGARNRCTKHAPKGKGLRESDFRPFHKELVRQIDENVTLLQPSFPDLTQSNASLRQLVCNIVGCGYEPRIKPLHEFVMLARNIRMHFFPPDIDWQKKMQENDSDNDQGGSDGASDEGHGETPTQEDLQDLMMDVLGPEAYYHFMHGDILDS